MIGLDSKLRCMKKLKYRRGWEDYRHNQRFRGYRDGVQWRFDFYGEFDGREAIQGPLDRVGLGWEFGCHDFVRLIAGRLQAARVPQ